MFCWFSPPSSAWRAHIQVQNERGGYARWVDGGELVASQVETQNAAVVDGVDLNLGQEVVCQADRQQIAEPHEKVRRQHLESVV